jgi:tRNA (guanine-N7-)-methyltransferase
MVKRTLFQLLATIGIPHHIATSSFPASNLRRISNRPLSHIHQSQNVYAQGKMHKLTEVYNINVTENHPKTAETALKHCATYGKYAENTIFATHNVKAFEEACKFVDKFYAKKAGVKLVILDSGCGAGLSTCSLANLYPNLPVIGVDRSIVRLSKNRKVDIITPDASRSEEPRRHEQPEQEQEQEQREDLNYITDNDNNNAVLLRAELVDFFMLAATRSDWVIHSHYLLYPNPYPKAKHLKRRFHGHPVFPAILALGGKLVVRSNWEVYCTEFSESVGAIVDAGVVPGLHCDFRRTTLPITDSSESHSAGNNVTTHFETKYRAVGLSLYEVSFDLGHRSRSQRIEMLTGISNLT